MIAKICKIEVFCIGMPLVGTFTSGGVSKNVTKCVVVRVTASDSAIGISSIDPSSTAKSPHTGPELALAIRDRIAPALIGMDPGNANRIVEVASKLTPSQPGAVVGVELACIELVCRRAGTARAKPGSELATPRWRSATAFCSDAISTGLSGPLPRPSTSE